MKKLLACALMLTALTTVVASTETVFVIWPWGMGDSDAQISRSVMHNANQNQKNLNLLFENKSGAGASIAAMYVAKNPSTVLAASSAFFVRPNFYTEGVHSIDNFRPLMLMCSGPLVITSGKYSNWNEVPRDKPLTIGLAGPGTTSHLVAELIRAKYPLSEVVPYRSTNEPMIDAMAGRVDFAVGFVEPAEQFIDTGRLNALGVTGTKTVRKIPTLYSQGFANADVVVNHHSWLVSKQMPDGQFRKLQEIARESIKSPRVQEEFNNLHCEHKGLVGEAANNWFNIQVTFWRDQSKKALENSK